MKSYVDDEFADSDYVVWNPGIISCVFRAGSSDPVSAGDSPDHDRSGTGPGNLLEKRIPRISCIPEVLLVSISVRIARDSLSGVSNSAFSFTHLPSYCGIVITGITEIAEMFSLWIREVFGWNVCRINTVCA